MRLLHALFATVLIAPSVVHAFTILIHRDMTSDQLSTISEEIAGTSLGFTEEALEEIADENEAVDSRFSGSAALFAPERHFTNETFAASTGRLVTLRQEVIDKALAGDGTAARKALGQALHTVQDFYSHSNWVESGNPSIVSAFGISTLTDPPAILQACPADPNALGSGGGGGSTSAYFVESEPALFLKETYGCDLTLLPAGKCFHGNYRAVCPGINKDNDMTVGGVPPSPFHGQARGLAEQATLVYTQGIVDVLDAVSPAEQRDRALSALFGASGTLGFVIDDTGSMAPEIAGVKIVVEGIVSIANLFPFTMPTNYLLEQFGDPFVGTPFVTDDPAQLLAAVNGISVGGGGDCPELSQTGLLRAVDAAFPNSRLMLFTDASSKDAALANSVISRAQKKQIRLNYLLTGTCSPVDPAYERGAAETGGQLFFVNEFEIGALLPLVEPQLQGDLRMISSTRGLLAPSDPSALLAFPVDSTISQLVVTASADFGLGLTLKRPNGVNVQPGDADVEITMLSGAAIITVSEPAIGEWAAEVSGSGDYSLVAEGNSPLQLYRFEIVDKNLDIHGGFMPIAGQPLSGADVIGEATLLGPFGTASFNAVNEQGDPILPLNLNQGFPEAAADHFLGTFPVPEVPFRVVASGTDFAGAAFHREFPVVFSGRMVGVEVSSAPGGSIADGETKTLEFVVRNLDDIDMMYQISAVTDLGSITRIAPEQVLVTGGGVAKVEVDLAAPSSLASDSDLTLTVTATKIGNALVSNSATVVLRASINSPPIAICQDVSVDADAMCQGSASVDAGSFDPDGDDVITLDQSPTSPYELGTTSVVLTARDASGTQNQCSAVVTVVDVTTPTLTCALEPDCVDSGDKRRNRKDDDDDGGARRCKRMLRVRAEAADSCGPTDLAAELQCLGRIVPVELNQVFVFKRVQDDDDDDGGAKCRVRERRGVLEIRGPAATLNVVARDESGNEEICTDSVGRSRRDDDDDGRGDDDDDRRRDDDN